jgi:carboxyl-terminal processing protease
MKHFVLGLCLMAALTVASPVGAQQEPGRDTTEAVPPDSTRGRPRVLRQLTLAEDLQLFSQVLNMLRVNHPDTVNLHELVTAAIQAMVSASDPFSGYAPMERLDPQKEAELIDGRYVFVPISFTFVQGRPLVAQVAPGTRAAQQDILRGDELTTIDGERVAATSSTELEIVLAGPRDETVRLGFDRWALDGTRVSFERDVRRESPEEGTAVPGAVMMNDSVGYVRILSFNTRGVAAELRDRVEELEDQGMKALILDLRDNGGGYVDQSAEIAAEFLPEGAIVYTMFGRKAEVTDTGRVERSFWESERNYPMVVMVNEGTASASELVSGALQDHDRALVVGRATMGKSLAMNTLPLNNGSEMTGQLYINIGRIRTPCGRVIQRSYANMSVSRFFALAGEPVDTTGLPSCKTTKGRTLYGGGAIRPDVFLPRPDVLPRPDQIPLWRLRAGQRGVGLRWAASFVSDRREMLTDPLVLLEDSVADAAVASYVERVRSEGIEVPEGADTAELRFTLLSLVAETRFGEEGKLQVESRLDPEIEAAIAELPKARELLELPAPASP